jgi:hypothetical protein
LEEEGEEEGGEPAPVPPPPSPSPAPPALEGWICTETPAALAVPCHGATAQETPSPLPAPPMRLPLLRLPSTLALNEKSAMAVSSALTSMLAIASSTGVVSSGEPTRAEDSEGVLGGGGDGDDGGVAGGVVGGMGGGGAEGGSGGGGEAGGDGADGGLKHSGSVPLQLHM